MIPSDDVSRGQDVELVRSVFQLAYELAKEDLDNNAYDPQQATAHAVSLGPVKKLLCRLDSLTGRELSDILKEEESTLFPDEDLRWAFDKFEEELGPDAKPPIDPEQSYEWEDWRDAWKVLKDRFLEMSRERDVLERAFEEACRCGFVESERMRGLILRWAEDKEADSE